MSEGQSRGLKIAVVGDVHGYWSDEDTEWFNRSDYDWIFFVGDIGVYRHKETLRVARSIARLRRPVVLIPGNHDGPSAGQLASTALGQGRLSDWLGSGMGRRVDELTDAFGSVQFSGYERITLGFEMDLIVARPHSMGGADLHFQRHLRERFGVDSMEDSSRRLKELIDESDARSLLFLAHNGPTGLGGGRADIWGCDFRKEEGDFGDPDLAEAITHARDCGKRVLAVVAGHMHRRLRGGGRRTWHERREGTLYVNAAEVPRVRQPASLAGPEEAQRHHVELVLLDSEEVSARDRWV